MRDLLLMTHKKFIAFHFVVLKYYFYFVFQSTFNDILWKSDQIIMMT